LVSNSNFDECLGTSVKARLVKLKEFVPKLPKNQPLVFIVGAVAKSDPGISIPRF
jgi:hypothetical protein